MNDQVTSIIRTLVPMIAGWLLTRLVNWGFAIDAATLESFLTILLGGVYYIVVRLLETKFPKLGYLLGVAKVPVYEGAHEG